MNSVVLPALAATLGTWFVTALGASAVIFFKDPKIKTMNLMLAISSGVMIAASFWSLLEPAISQAEKYLKTPAWLVATVGFLGGAVFMWLIDKCINHMFLKIQAEKNHSQITRIFMLVFSITLHNIPEGLAVGVAFGAVSSALDPQEAFMGAISIAVGIGLQNFPEGAAVSLPLRREGYSRVKSFLIGQASAIVEPIAGVIGALLVMKIKTILPFALSFAAGAMILVAVHELIPECQKDREKTPYLSTMGIIMGFALMMLLDVALG